MSGDMQQAPEEHKAPGATDYGELVSDLQKKFLARQLKGNSYEWRVSQLKALKKMLVENEDRWNEALFKDLGRHNSESYLFETIQVLAEVDLAQAKLKKWMKPEKASTTLLTQPASAQYYPEPLGTVLIIAPWNFPMALAMVPLIGAIAAGNNVFIKPSEVTANVGALFEELVPKYMDSECIKSKVEAVEGTTRILKEKWDMILFTGSPPVGRIVMSAAAKHLTPVVLELGGKSPCIVTKDCDLPSTARRIAFGKYSNCGQICIAPDYLFCDPEVQEGFVKALKDVLVEMYGEDPKENDSYARIVSERRVDALSNLLKDNKFKVELGGLDTVDKAARYFPPTILTDVDLESAVMQEEIFGPILPIIKMESIDKAIEFINSRPKPLALYVFTSSSKVSDQFLAQTSAGGVLINDTIMQAGCPLLPFGGVGESGMGKYHGKTTFDVFSHRKPVMYRTMNVLDSKNPRYAPYTEGKANQIKKIAGLSQCSIM